MTADVAAPSAHRRGRGSAARRELRQHTRPRQLPAIVRRIPLMEILNEEGLQIIENNAETILQEIGIEFRDDPEALAGVYEAILFVAARPVPLITASSSMVRSCRETSGVQRVRSAAGCTAR